MTNKRCQSHTEHTKSNEDKADKTMSRIHRKASPCQHRVLGPWVASPNAKDQKAQELESLIRNLVRIPATSRMWSMYVHEGSKKIHGGDTVEAPLWYFDHKMLLRPKGGWNDVRAWTSIQGSSHLGTSGRRPIGLEDAFSLGWAWSGTCYHESSPSECTCHHCRTFWNIILR